MSDLVTFRTGTKAQYDALQNKDQNSLYFLTDSGHEMLFKGNVDMSEQFSITSSPLGQGYIRLVRKLNGQAYDLPLGATVNGLLDAGLVLFFDENWISSDEEFLAAINAVVGSPGTGEFKEGQTFRVAKDFRFNPGQFTDADDTLDATQHDLIIALKGRSREDHAFQSNHDMFAVIPTDLVNLVTATGNLDVDKVVVGAGNRGVKTFNFDGGGKVLASNAAGTALEWLDPEGIAAEVVWQSIGS